MNLSRPLSRRSFLRQLAAAGAAAPFITRGLIAAPPSSVIRHASFGGAGMAMSDLTGFKSHPHFRLVCVAEVDAARTAKLKEAFPEAKVYQDWREMLDREHANLDSVNVSTPDHMHAPMGMSALQLGLHVYGQKPLAHDVFECRRLAEFASEKKLVTQIGIQIHSSVEYRSAVQLIQAGAIGKVREVHTWSSKKWSDPQLRPDSSDPVPAGFNWDLWLGVCAPRPFLAGGYYHPGNWRKRIDFGTGTFGDMGCHIYDPVFKALQLTAPLSVRSEGPPPNADNWGENAVVHYTFPGTSFSADSTVRVTWYDGDQRPPPEVRAQLGTVKQPDQGSIFLGTDGILVLPHVGRPILLPEEKSAAAPQPTLEPVSHWHQFLDAVQGKGATSAHFGYAGPLTEAVLLGGIASRFPQTTLEWDAAAMQFRNLPAANQFLRRTYRPGWEVKGLA